MDKQVSENSTCEQLKNILLSDGPESRMQEFLSGRRISVGMVDTLVVFLKDGNMVKSNLLVMFLERMVETYHFEASQAVIGGLKVRNKLFFQDLFSCLYGFIKTKSGDDFVTIFKLLLEVSNKYKIKTEAEKGNRMRREVLFNIDVSGLSKLPSSVGNQIIKYLEDLILENWDIDLAHDLYNSGICSKFHDTIAKGIKYIVIKDKK